MSSRSEKCVVVGGGVIGLSVAWQLASRGYSCTVLDQGRMGRSASWAGAGILPPARLDTAEDAIDKLRGLSHALHPEWARRLESESGHATQFQECGGLYLARSPGEAASLAGLCMYWAEYGIETERLTIAELIHREPALAGGLAESSGRGVVWVPNEYQMHPAEHLKALIGACRRRGVALRESVRVDALPTQGNRVTGVAAGTHFYDADHVLLCCGAWASQFADPRGRIGDVFPVRGQVLLLRAVPGTIRSILNEGHRYLVPRLDGHIYVGSNEEEVGLVEGTTETAQTELHQWATSLAPGLNDFEVVRRWSGLRPGSFDTFPFVGRSHQCENLYVATGHFRSGLHLSCGTAVVLSELVAGDSPSIPLDAFRISRSVDHSCKTH